MSISRNVQGGVVAAPRLVAVHLGGEVEEELLAECFGAVRTRHDRCIEAPVDNLGEVDVVGFPIDERDASFRQVCFGDTAGPVGGPCVVREVNGGCPPELRCRLGQTASAVVLPEQRTRCGLENGRFARNSVYGVRKQSAVHKNYDARQGDSAKHFSNGNGSYGELQFRDSARRSPSHDEGERRPINSASGVSL